MCVCFGVERFHTIFLRQNKVQAAFANYRWLAGQMCFAGQFVCV